ncbi:MAG: hypothetical protein KDA05_07890, partial [Phycisphaerales bacterium]|nr:hypothetical protein [Phycisphaerales bacterium]
MKSFRVGVPLAAACLQVCAGGALAQSSFTNLGTSFRVNTCSGDGTVLGVTAGSQVGTWSESTGLVLLGGRAGNGWASISRDGTTLAANAINPSTNLEEMAISLGGGAWQLLGGLAASSGVTRSTTWGVNDDGSIVVGLGWLSPAAGWGRAVYWTQGTGMVDLGTTVPTRSTRANCVNADGSVIGGWQDSTTGYRQGAVWINGVQQLMVDNANVALLMVNNINSAGTVWCGDGSASGGGPYVRTPANGIERLGVLPGTNTHLASDVSDDGNIVIGASDGPFGTGWIWVRGQGIQSLADYAASRGVTIPAGTPLNVPIAMSDDGSVITGFSFGPPGFSWRLVFDDACEPDLTTGAIAGQPGYGVPNGVLNND